MFVFVTVFLEEIVELFEMLASSNQSILLAGYMDIYWEKDELYSNRFKAILDSFNIIQYVDFPTHKCGHTLDIIASFQNSLTISGLQANEYEISHHFLVDFCIAISPESKESKRFSYRKLKSVNHVAFASDISNQLHLSDSVSFGKNVKANHDVLAAALNEHVPMKSRIIKIVHNAP